MERTLSKKEAQQRVEQIDSFRREIGLLKRHGIVEQSGGQDSSILTYHAEIVAGYAQAFDIDLDNRGKQNHDFSGGDRPTGVIAALSNVSFDNLFFSCLQPTAVTLNQPLAAEYEQLTQSCQDFFAPALP